MRIIFNRLLFLLAFTWLFLGCMKDMEDCSIQHTSGQISAISGPDSMRTDKQDVLTFEVEAPGLCVVGVNINLSKISDSLYHADADVQYSSGKNNNCPCQVKEKHYARLYFESHVAGIISFETGPGIGKSVRHTVNVIP